MPTQVKEKPVSSSSSSSRARALLSKKSKGGVEAGETSFRVYYGATGAAVPFMWESQPGTPKHPMFNTSNDHIVPPLTPPPSYNSSSSSSSKTSNRRPRIIFSALLSSISRRSRSHVSPTTSSSYSGPLSWSTSSSSSSSVSSPLRVGRKKHQQYKSHKRSMSLCSDSGSKFPLFDDDEQEEEDVGASSPPSGKEIMCFGFKKQGCYSMKGVKHAILSIKGH